MPMLCGGGRVLGAAVDDDDGEEKAVNASSAAEPPLVSHSERSIAAHFAGRTAQPPRGAYTKLALAERYQLREPLPGTLGHRSRQ